MISTEPSRILKIAPETAAETRTAIGIVKSDATIIGNAVLYCTFFLYLIALYVVVAQEKSEEIAADAVCDGIK